MTFVAAIIGSFVSGLVLGAIVVGLGMTWANSHHNRYLDRNKQQ